LRKTKSIWGKLKGKKKNKKSLLKAFSDFNYTKNPNFYKYPFKPMPRKPNTKGILFRKSIKAFKAQYISKEAQRDQWKKTFYMDIPVSYLSPQAFQPDFENLSSD